MLCMYIFFLVASHFLTFIVSSNDGGKIKTTSCSLCYSHIHTHFEQKLQEWLSNKVHGILNVHSKESCRHNKMCFKCNNEEAAFCCLEKKEETYKTLQDFAQTLACLTIGPIWLVQSMLHGVALREDYKFLLQSERVFQVQHLFTDPYPVFSGYECHCLFDVRISYTLLKATQIAIGLKRTVNSTVRT